MKLIGLTGGVGSGKTTVAKMLQELGAVVVDADEAAHAAYEPGTPGFAAVVSEFGEEFFRGCRCQAPLERDRAPARARLDGGADG